VADQRYRYWNCYPGARVDSDAPIYQLFDKEIYHDFEFKERYPGWQELRRYFDYLDQKLELSKDTVYNKTLTAATFDESSHKWTCHFHDGSSAVCRWLVPAIGFAAKEYIPPYKGLDKYKGELYHTAKWPQSGAELKGKRIAVIGGSLSYPMTGFR
jgi:cation diffusion facilitator CzcD-associated flavoprotein CzcO